MPSNSSERVRERGQRERVGERGEREREGEAARARLTATTAEISTCKMPGRSAGVTTAVGSEQEAPRLQPLNPNLPSILLCSGWGT